MACCLGPLLALLATVCLTLPALRTMVRLCGELGCWRGRGMDGLERGPPYYPELSGWVPGLRFRFGGGGGGWRYTSLGARLQAKGLKDSRRPHVGNVRSQKPIISTALPLNIPRLSWNACWQLAAANLLTPTHAISTTMRQCPGISKRPGPPSLCLKITQGKEGNSADLYVFPVF